MTRARACSPVCVVVGATHAGRSAKAKKCSARIKLISFSVKRGGPGDSVICSNLSWDLFDHRRLIALFRTRIRPLGTSFPPPQLDSSAPSSHSFISISKSAGRRTEQARAQISYEGIAIASERQHCNLPSCPLDTFQVPSSLPLSKYGTLLTALFCHPPHRHLPIPALCILQGNRS